MLSRKNDHGSHPSNQLTIAMTLIHYRQDGNPIDHALLSYSLNFDEASIPRSLVWLAIRSDQSSSMTLHLCSPAPMECYRVKVTDLLKVHPRLSKEVFTSEVLVYLNKMSDPSDLETLRPWINQPPITDAEHQTFLDRLDAITVDQIEELLVMLRSGEQIPKPGSNRLITQSLPAQIYMLLVIWQSSSGAEREQVYQVISRMFHHLSYAPVIIWMLLVRVPEVIPYLATSEIQAGWIIALSQKSSRMFTLDQAQHALEMLSRLPRDHFDLVEGMRETRHQHRADPVLDNLYRFQARLNVFLSGHDMSDPLGHLDWDRMAVIGLAVVFSLSQSGMRTDLRNQRQELGTLYSNVGLRLVCNHERLDLFLDHVLDSIEMIECNLGSAGSYQVNRSATIYSATGQLYDREDTSKGYQAACRQMNLEIDHVAPRHHLDRSFREVPIDQISITRGNHRVQPWLDQPIERSSSKQISSRWIAYWIAGSKGEIYALQSVEIRYTHERLIRPIVFSLIQGDLVQYARAQLPQCVRAIYRNELVHLDTSALIAWYTGRVHLPEGDHTKLITRYACLGFLVHHPDPMGLSDQSDPLLSQDQLVSARSAVPITHPKIDDDYDDDDNSCYFGDLE